MDFSSSSRAEKISILEGVIENLQIRNEEKDLYFFSMQLLDNSSFETFFQKIMKEFSDAKNSVQFVQQ